MVVKRGRIGMFLAYPECKTTRTKQRQRLEARSDFRTCGKNLVVKQGRFGEFTACTGYPGFTGIVAQDGGATSSAKVAFGGKEFYGCANYPSATSRYEQARLLSRVQVPPAFLTEKVHQMQLRVANSRSSEECDYVRSEERIT